MNELDDLIRASLREHTRAGAPDENLAEVVTATGRRIRRARTAGLAALSLVVVAGLAWGWAAVPLLAQQGIAAVPTMSQPTPVPPPPSPKVTVRDVSAIGEPSEGANNVQFLNNSFASPSGNFHCFISSAGAGCAGEKWDRGVAPSRAKVCPDMEPLLGPELWGSAPAKWSCGSDPHSIPLLGGEGGRGGGRDGEDGSWRGGDVELEDAVEAVAAGVGGWVVELGGGGRGGECGQVGPREGRAAGGDA